MLSTAAWNVPEQAPATRSAPETAAGRAPASPTPPSFVQTLVQTRGDRVPVAIACVCEAAVGDADLTYVSLALTIQAEMGLSARTRGGTSTNAGWLSAVLTDPLYTNVWPYAFDGRTRTASSQSVRPAPVDCGIMPESDFPTRSATVGVTSRVDWLPPTSSIARKRIRSELWLRRTVHAVVARTCGIYTPYSADGNRFGS
jgi:hypothetical protein